MKKFIRKEQKRFSDAAKGLLVFLSSAEHAIFHSFAACITIIAAWYFCVSTIEWLLIILCIGFVFFAEAVNESIECLADFIYKEQHPDIGKIKDIAAGAVLVAAITSAVIGIIIFLPKIIEQLN
ncbi:MAG: diacylglycerol kinase family protein [Bacteroidetes bacterium]|nr:diacylglycerol kinase family protein [Bacteroidota bacterium]MBP7397998.1 diacylglycerol kinase family protein [Chitinophagales bacterium]MBK7108562.1 diacylglycerol kinase family protein [Bacteroidota bacterium]MBK8489113.1 diacylglycerol kinase family protein [Bacteroidota bacterium]MBK8680962.1 diacylglycerol kinase family protein [Bacteroidota bacterium]